MTMSGARNGEGAQRPMPVPDGYVRVDGLDRVTQSPALIVAHEYEQLLHDLRAGTTVVSTWEDAVGRHESIELTE